MAAPVLRPTLGGGTTAPRPPRLTISLTAARALRRRAGWRASSSITFRQRRIVLCIALPVARSVGDRRCSSVPSCPAAQTEAKAGTERALGGRHGRGQRSPQYGLDLCTGYAGARGTARPPAQGARRRRVTCPCRAGWGGQQRRQQRWRRRRRLSAGNL